MENKLEKNNIKIPKDISVIYSVKKFFHIFRTFGTKRIKTIYSTFHNKIKKYYKRYSNAIL